MNLSRLKILGLSPFHFACAFTNCTQIIDDMLTDGADIDEVSKYGSPLCFAAWRGKTDMVRHLLRRGACMGLAGPDGCELLVAAAEGHSETCKVLIDLGADVNQKHPSLPNPAPEGRTEALQLIFILQVLT